MSSRLPAALLALLLALGTPALAAGPSTTEITVTGQGTVMQTPNLAYLNASITTNDDNAQKATSENQQIYDQLVAAMHDLGIPETDIKTTYLNLNYNRRPVPRGATGAPMSYAPMYGYIDNRGLNITIRDTSLAGKALDAAVAAGVANVNGVSFGVEQTRDAYNQALLLAVADAQRQAQTMASAAHLRIVRIKSMQQGVLGQPPRPMPLAINSGARATVVYSTNIPSSGVATYATVTITYVAVP